MTYIDGNTRSIRLARCSMFGDATRRLVSWTSRRLRCRRSVLTRWFSGVSDSDFQAVSRVIFWREFPRSACYHKSCRWLPWLLLIWVCTTAWFFFLLVISLVTWSVARECPSPLVSGSYGCPLDSGNPRFTNLSVDESINATAATNFVVLPAATNIRLKGSYRPKSKDSESHWM